MLQMRTRLLLPIPMFIGGLGLTTLGPQVGGRGTLAAAVAVPLGTPPKLPNSAKGSLILLSRLGVLAFLCIGGAGPGRFVTVGDGFIKVSQLPMRDSSVF